MAEDLDDGEFWLPSHFLTEEDILMDFDTSSTTLSSSGFNSELGSPVDSVTETESDEDDFLSGLTHQLSRSSLLPQSSSTNTNSNSNSKALSGSPPRQTGLISPVGEVGRAKKGTGYFDSSRGLVKQSTPVPVSPPKNPNFNSGFSPKSQVIIPPQSKIFPNSLQPVWNQGVMKQQRMPPLMSSSAWPTVQRAVNRQPIPAAAATQMRAVFLGPPPGSKRESVGTGVFLPRLVNASEPRKKSNKHEGCATVLVPEKVVQALKNINTQSQSQPKLDSTKRVQGHGNGIHGAKRNSDNAGARSGASVEIQLPSEWTY